MRNIQSKILFAAFASCLALPVTADDSVFRTHLVSPIFFSGEGSTQESLSTVLDINFPTGIVERGTSFSTTIVPSGGIPPYSYAISSGSLPFGLSLLQDGTIYGDIMASSAPFTISVMDSAGTMAMIDVGGFTVPPASCTAPWGETVFHGAGVEAFYHASMPFGSSCTTDMQMRTCNDGVLSGSYVNQSCTTPSSATVGSIFTASLVSRVSSLYVTSSLSVPVSLYDGNANVGATPVPGRFPGKAAGYLMVPKGQVRILESNDGALFQVVFAAETATGLWSLSDCQALITGLSGKLSVGDKVLRIHGSSPGSGGSATHIVEANTDFTSLANSFCDTLFGTTTAYRSIMVSNY